MIAKKLTGRAPNAAGFYISSAFFTLTAKATANKMLTWAEVMHISVAYYLPLT